MRGFRDSNAAYESWLRGRCSVVEPDLAEKHARMARDPLAFLRATCFRFAELYPGLFPAHLDLPKAASVGDAHIENFGTWRDLEGRLAWGVNDLDEAALLPFPADLVRLAASAALVDHAPAPRDAAELLLKGYRERLAAPRPFVLDERHATLRDAAAPSPDQRRDFWAEVDALPEARPPRFVRAALLADLPAGWSDLRFAARSAGLGSRGRPRFVAVAEWGGGRVVREAKTRLPSAWTLSGFAGAKPRALARSPHRAQDPWLSFPKGLVLRRLAPDSRKLNRNKKVPDSWQVFLEAMGGEIANTHALGHSGTIAEALGGFGAAALAEAAERAAEAVRRDHAEWAEGGP